MPGGAAGGAAVEAGSAPAQQPSHSHTLLFTAYWVHPSVSCYEQVVCHAAPLAAPLWKQVLRLLNSPAFHARAALIPAIARLAPGAAPSAAPPNPNPRIDPAPQLRVLGMVAGHRAQCAAPHLQGLVGGVAQGVPLDPWGEPGGPGGGGLVGALAAAEWAARLAAAECLRALCIELGPGMDRVQVGETRPCLGHTTHQKPCCNKV